jgi:hypothetical protein
MGVPPGVSRSIGCERITKWKRGKEAREIAN